MEKPGRPSVLEERTGNNSRKQNATQLDVVGERKKNQSSSKKDTSVIRAEPEAECERTGHFFVSNSLTDDTVKAEARESNNDDDKRRGTAGRGGGGGGVNDASGG